MHKKQSRNPIIIFCDIYRTMRVEIPPSVVDRMLLAVEDTLQLAANWGKVSVELQAPIIVNTLDGRNHGLWINITAPGFDNRKGTSSVNLAWSTNYGIDYILPDLREIDGIYVDNSLSYSMVVGEMYGTTQEQYNSWYRDLEKLTQSRAEWDALVAAKIKFYEKNGVKKQ